MASGHNLYSVLQRRCQIQQAKPLKRKCWYRIHLWLKALCFAPSESVVSFSSQHNVPPGAVLLNKGLSFRVESHSEHLCLCMCWLYALHLREDTLGHTETWIFRPLLHKYFRMQDSYLRRRQHLLLLHYNTPVCQAPLRLFHCPLFQFGELVGHYVGLITFH